MNEGDLLVTALSLGFATTALREQPACADTVVDKASGWEGLGPGGISEPWFMGSMGVVVRNALGPLLWQNPALHGVHFCWRGYQRSLTLRAVLQVLPQALALVKSPLLQGECLRGCGAIGGPASFGSAMYAFLQLCRCIFALPHCTCTSPSTAHQPFSPPSSPLPSPCPRRGAGGAPGLLPGPGGQRCKGHLGGEPAGAAARRRHG